MKLTVVIVPIAGLALLAGCAGPSEAGAQNQMTQSQADLDNEDLPTYESDPDDVVTTENFDGSVDLSVYADTSILSNAVLLLGCEGERDLDVKLTGADRAAICKRDGSDVQVYIFDSPKRFRQHRKVLEGAEVAFASSENFLIAIPDRPTMVPTLQASLDG